MLISTYIFRVTIHENRTLYSTMSTTPTLIGMPHEILVMILTELYADIRIKRIVWSRTSVAHSHSRSRNFSSMFLVSEALHALAKETFLRTATLHVDAPQTVDKLSTPTPRTKGVRQGEHMIGQFERISSDSWIANIISKRLEKGKKHIFSSMRYLTIYAHEPISGLVYCKRSTTV